MIFGYELWGDCLLGVLFNGVSLLLLYWLGKELYSCSLFVFFILVVYGIVFIVVYWVRVVSINSFVLLLIIVCLVSVLFCCWDLRGGLFLGLIFSVLVLINLFIFIVLFVISLVFFYWDIFCLKFLFLFGFGLVLGLLLVIFWWLGYGFLFYGEIVDLIMVIGGFFWFLKLRGWFWLLVSFFGLIFVLNIFFWV